jgi:hypothetical protein
MKMKKKSESMRSLLYKLLHPTDIKGKHPTDTKGEHPTDMKGK